MNRVDTLNRSQVGDLFEYLVGDGPLKELSSVVMGWFGDGVVDVDWFLSRVRVLAELSGDVEMLNRISGLRSLRDRAIRIYEGMERCREEMERLRLDGLSLHRECGCKFASSSWDGVESSLSCPFCFA